MARPPRIEFQGDFYHVITHGNQQAIFYDNYDRIRKQRAWRNPSPFYYKTKTHTYLFINFIKIFSASVIASFNDISFDGDTEFFECL